LAIRSESDCLFGLLNKILDISDSQAGLTTEKSGEATGACGEVEEEFLALIMEIYLLSILCYKYLTLTWWIVLINVVTSRNIFFYLRKQCFLVGGAEIARPDYAAPFVALEHG